MADLKVVSVEALINDGAVGLLEDALADAKAGRIRDIVLASTCPDGSVRTAFSYSDNRILQVAAISRLLHRMQINLDEDHD